MLDTVVAAATPEGIILELHPAALTARFYAILLDLLIRVAVLDVSAILRRRPWSSTRRVRRRESRSRKSRRSPLSVHSALVTRRHWFPWRRERPPLRQSGWTNWLHWQLPSPATRAGLEAL